MYCSFNIEESHRLSSEETNKVGQRCTLSRVEKQRRICDIYISRDGKNF
jgi:hypothetical protein